MKKILFLFVALIAVFTVSSCEEVVEDAAKVLLQDAKDSLNGVIGDPTNITATFQVPVNLMNDVTAVWSSSNPGVITFGVPVSGLATATVNRPAFGEPDAVVTLTAVLMIESAANATEFLSDEFVIQVTVKASEVEEVTIENIADVLALQDVAYDGTYQVTLTGLTIIGKGSDSAFAYDGSGIIQIYGGDISRLEVGKVYDVAATTEWYFGIWELVAWTATLDATATAQMPTKEAITDVAAYVNGLLNTDQDQFAYGDASDGAFETIYATVTGRVYVIPGDTSSYNTYIMPTNYDTTQTWVPGTTDVPTVGLMIYYNTLNLAEIRAYNGKVITVDVLIYTFRSNNKAFAFYYVGGADGITANLTDTEKAEVVVNSLTLTTTVLENTTLTLPTTGDNNAVITWTSNNTTAIDPTTGVVTVPTNEQITVKLTASVVVGTSNAVLKEFEIKVGVVPPPSEPDLFISEYIEGSSNNKAIELYNPTGAALDLTGYMVHIYSNGSPTATKSFDLTGVTLGIGETYVIVTDTFAGTGTYDEVQAFADSDAVVFFNGDDALSITKNGELIDVFGVIGEDPGTNWPVGTGFTSEFTLVRKPGITGGSDTWNPEEWIVYPQNTFDKLGTHEAVRVDLFISEYIEGSSNNKAIELYNPTGAALDLTGYMVHIYSNGSPTATKSFDLTGVTLGIGETYVIVTDTFAGTGTYDEVQAFADSDAVVFFNGDDALSITKNGELIDVFGVIGEDPGTNWPVGTGFTSEFTLVRKPGITGGSDTWNPEEWIVYPQNTFDYLGSHSA